MIKYLHNFNEIYIIEQIFDDFYIGKNPTPNGWKFLVLYLSFSCVSPDGDVEMNFKKYINTRLKGFILSNSRYLGLNPNDIVDSEDHLNSLTMFFQAVNSVGEEVFLIVDEYDSFANRLLLQVDTTSSDLGMEHYKATVSDKESFLRCVERS